MKNIVIYQSDTGFTERYAKWIAEELNCEAVKLKGFDLKTLESFDKVIYGGWIMGNMIVGFDKLRELKLKSLVVFGVGVTPTSDTIIQTIQSQNKLGELPFFYFEGGLDQKKLGFLKRTILKTLAKATAKKEDKTEQEEFMVNALVSTFDHCSHESIAALISRCKEEAAG